MDKKQVSESSLKAPPTSTYRTLPDSHPFGVNASSRNADFALNFHKPRTINASKATKYTTKPGHIPKLPPHDIPVNNGNCKLYVTFHIMYRYKKKHVS